jgi:hypothetical protein
MKVKANRKELLKKLEKEQIEWKTQMKAHRIKHLQSEIDKLKSFNPRADSLPSGTRSYDEPREPRYDGERVKQFIALLRASSDEVVVLSNDEAAFLTGL